MKHDEGIHTLKAIAIWSVVGLAFWLLIWVLAF